MTYVGRTRSISAHKYRWAARLKERRLQRSLDAGVHPSELGLPVWAHGVRTEKIGNKQHAVIATEGKGH